MKKKELRQEQIKKLLNFQKYSQKQLEDQILTEEFLKIDLENIHNVGIYLSMPFEVDTSKIIEKLLNLEKKIYIPRCLPNFQMDFTEYSFDSNLTKSKFGVYENQEKDAKVLNDLDLIIVPGLAFDSYNHQRLGFGAGYYDRFLAKYPIKSVSLVNTIQLFNSAKWTPDCYDVPIDELIVSELNKDVINSGK